MILVNHVDIPACKEHDIKSNLRPQLGTIIGTCVGQKLYTRPRLGSITHFRDDFYIFPLAVFMNLSLV